MLVPNVSDKNIGRTKAHTSLNALDFIMHVDLALKDNERLSTIVLVPLVGLIGPMQANGRPFDVDQIASTPSAIGYEGRDVLDNLRHRHSRLTRR